MKTRTDSTHVPTNYLEELVAWGEALGHPIEIERTEQGSLEVVFHERPEQS